MSLIGQEVELVKGGTIKVKNEKTVDNTLIVTDENGNIYTEDELNIRYIVTAPYLLYLTLIKNNCIDMEWDSKFFEKIFNDLMHALEKSGYVEQSK